MSRSIQEALTPIERSEVDPVLRQVVLESESLLGFFHVHALVEERLFQETFERTTKLEERTKQAIDSGRNVLVVYEEADKKASEPIRRDIEHLLHDPNTPRTPKSLTTKKLLEVLDAAALAGNAQAAFRALKLAQYFRLKMDLGNDSDRLTGILERSPKIVDPMREFKEVVDESMDIEEKITRYLNFTTYLIARDLSAAAQILNRDNLDNTLVVVLKGTAHLGLIPGLTVLSGGIFPGIDLNNQFSTQVNNIHAPYLPIVWSQRLWQEIVSESQVNLFKARNDNFLNREVVPLVKQKLSENPWIDFLNEALAVITPSVDEFTQVSLGSDIFAE